MAHSGPQNKNSKSIYFSMTDECNNLKLSINVKQVRFESLNHTEFYLVLIIIQEGKFAFTLIKSPILANTILALMTKLIWHLLFRFLTCSDHVKHISI